MITVFTYLSIALSFFLVLLTLPRWIANAFNMEFTGIDLNKNKKVNVAEAGGICVVFGFIAGFFIYSGFMVFYYNVASTQILFALAAAATILLAALIGFVDDILGWRAGLGKSYKVLFTFFIPLPVMVLNAGQSSMTLPILGSVEFGLIFPLILVPVAIVGTTNGFNMLAGYNGLEAGMGLIILSSLGMISYQQGLPYLAALCAVMCAALVAFLVFNIYPARVFPGDTLTYSIGALIGVIAILANIEKFALILFLPYFFELILKGRTFFKKSSWAKCAKDGSLKNKYGKWYGLPNVAISLLNTVKGKAYEYEVVALIWFLELGLVAVTFLSYYGVIAL